MATENKSNPDVALSEPVPLPVDPAEPIYWAYCSGCREIKQWGRDPQRRQDVLENQLAKVLEKKCWTCKTNQHNRGQIQTRLEASVAMRQMNLRLLSDPLAPEMVHADSRGELQDS